MHRILLALLICVLFNGSLAQQGALEQLNSMLVSIESLKADVVQLIVESDGGILEESKIKMYFKKPNGFYWETITPFRELIVTNGVKLWNYQPDLEQVVIEDWDSSKSELAAQFTLTPLATDSVYDRISISFVTSELDQIYLNSKNGQQTVWRFDAIERNEFLEDSVFEFEPPVGIEIIENTYIQ